MEHLEAPPTSALGRWLPPLLPGDPRHPLASADVAAAWNGVVWGRLGHGGNAWAWWDSVEDRSLLPWLAAERGRLLREVGLHDRARGLEEEGLAAAVDVVDAAMLRISLVADAVGVGDLDRARHALESVAAVVTELPESLRARRQRLRLRWVTVEVAWLAGERPPVAGLPTPGSTGPAFDVDHVEAGSDFHRAKSLLFAGVVREDTTLLDAAAALSPPSLLWAVELARLDAGDESAAARAVAAWDRLLVPPGSGPEVSRTPVATRVARLRAAA